MIDTIYDKCIIIFPVILISILYLILYNIIGNNAAEHGVNYRVYLTTDLDHYIPFIPSFLTIYLFAVIYPLLSILYLSKTSVISIHSFYRMYFTALLMIAVCGALWLIFPVRFDMRPSHAELLSNGFWGRMVSIFYNAITPWNAFPSFHIVISWFILRTMQLYSCKRLLVFKVLFYAIAASTVLIRIHYLADIVFGMLIAELFSNGILRYWEQHGVFNNLSRKAFIFCYFMAISILIGVFLTFVNEVDVFNQPIKLLPVNE